MKTSDMFQSKFLKASDLAGREAALVMATLVMEQGTDDQGKPEAYPVLYFAPPATKGLRLNKTNTHSIEAVWGDETDLWVGKGITIFPDTTSNRQGQIVPCIRVKVTPEQAQAGGSLPPRTDAVADQGQFMPQPQQQLPQPGQQQL